MRQTGLNRYEEKILSLRSVPRSLKSLVAGVSRVARLSGIQDSGHLRCVWDTGSSVIGPAFLFFVWWLMENAKKDGARRIYFLSRDAQILQKIALLLDAKFGYGIECRYLYVSRQACYLPAIDDIGDFEIDWIMKTDSDRSLSIDEVCGRIDISPGDIQNILNSYGFEKDAWGKNLSVGERRRLTKCLKNDGLQKMIAEKAAAQLKTAAGYLKQEGLGNTGRTYVVDLGWYGRIQYALSKILDKSLMRPEQGLKGLYFGIFDNEKIYKNDSAVSFLPLKWPMTLMNYMTINYTLYEIFAAADHGMVVGFSERDGVFSPVLNRQLNGEAISWGVSTQQASIVRFADIFTEHYSAAMPDLKSVHDILTALLEEFMQNPSPEEAAVYGSYIHDASMTEKALREVAPIITYADIFSSAIRADKTPKGTFWLTGSFVRSRMPFMQKVWYIVKRILYLLKIVVPV